MSLSKKEPSVPEDAGQKKLSIYLYSLSGNKSNDNWVIFANATIKIISPTFGVVQYKDLIETFMYSSECLGYIVINVVIRLIDMLCF